jgi:hypothetical protein
VSTEPAVALPHCSETHRDWSELCEHLATRFPSACFEDVISEVGSARAAAVRFGIPTTELLVIVERVATNRLMLQDGQLVDRTRLDPQPHLWRRFARD